MSKWRIACIPFRFTNKIDGMDRWAKEGSLCLLWMEGSREKWGEPKSWNLLKDLSLFFPAKSSFGMKPKEVGVLFKMHATWLTTQGYKLRWATLGFLIITVSNVARTNETVVHIFHSDAPFWWWELTLQKARFWLAAMQLSRKTP